MSSREEENAAAAREPTRQGACPFCWGYDIVFNTGYGTWRCNACEHSFATPSFGSGGPPPPRFELKDFVIRPFEVCPICGEKTLLYQKSCEVDYEFYKCMNKACHSVFGCEELEKIRKTKGIG